MILLAWMLDVVCDVEVSNMLMNASKVDQIMIILTLMMHSVKLLHHRLTPYYQCLKKIYNKKCEDNSL